MANLTIGKKLALLCAALLALNLFLGLTALYDLGRLGEDSEMLTATMIPGVHLAGRINTGAKAIILRVHRHLSSSHPEQMAQFETYLNNRNVSVREEIQAYGKLDLKPKERQLLERILKDLDGVILVWGKVRPLSLAGQKSEAVELFDAEGVKLSEDLDNAAKELVALNKVEGDAVRVASKARVSAARARVSGILVLSFLCGGALVLFMIRGLKRSLLAMVTDLSEGSHQVRTAAASISGASQSLAQGAAQQAASLEETSAAGTEISATANRNAEHTQMVVGLVEQSQKRFTEADASLYEMSAAMLAIDSSSSKISRIIKVIDEIAFQTNILALNAAVEAARAGEAGMGFGVVAEEVRSLAQRSAQAARDTAELIEDSIAKSSGGRTKMDHVMKAIRAVAEVSGRVQALVKEVHTGSQEQASGIEQMAKAMVQMEQLTQRTAAHAEESAAASEELNAQAESMRSMVSNLAAMAG